MASPKKVLNHWELSVELPRNPSGKRRMTRLSAHTKHAVLQKARRLLQDEEEHGPRPIRATRLLQDYLTEWLARQSLRLSTQRSYESIVRTHLLPALGKVNLARLTTAQIDDFYLTLQGKSERTRLHIHSVLRKALTDAVRRRLIRHNPLDQVTPPRPPRARPVVDSVAAVQGMLSRAEGTPVELLVYLAAYVGLSRSECLGLTWSAVDLPRRQLAVLQGRHPERLGGVTALKTSTRTRVLSIPEPLALRLALHQGASSTFVVSLTYDQSGWYTARLGIKLHQLRHFHATVLLQQLPLADVSERLGHRDVAVTAAYYIGSLPATDGAAARAIEQALGSKPMINATTMRQYGAISS